MKVIILAGGKATRLPNTAQATPKSLVKIRNKSLLEHQIAMLRKYGLEDIRFSLGYRAEQIIQYLNGRYEYVIEQEPLGTGGGLAFASRTLQEPFLALNGDVLGNFDFAAFLEKAQQQPGQNFIMVWQCPDCRDYGLVRTEQGRVKEFLEKPKEQCSGLINAGVYLLYPDVFKKSNLGKFFSAEHDIFPDLAQRGLLSAFIHQGSWIDVGTEERLKWAKENLKIKYA